MALDLVKVVVVVGGHLNEIPLLLETVGKVKAAENAVGVVDAVVPAQYAVARIVDEVRESAFSSDYVAFEVEAEKVCAAFNSLPASPGEATTKKLLTIDNLRSIAELILMFAPLLMKK